MHVLYLCNEYPPVPHGGLGTFIQTIARELVKHGHQASVIGFSPVKGYVQEDDLGVKVYRLPVEVVSKIQIIQRYYRLAEFIRKLNVRQFIDLIEGTELSYGLLPGRLPGKKILRIHGGHHFFSATLGQPWRFSTGLIEKISFARAERFCAVSHFAANETRRLLRLKEKPIEILPNPVDTAFFRPYPEIQEQEGLIVFTGGLREKKGVRQLVQAMPKVVSQFPNAKLMIYGGDTRDRKTSQSYLEILKKEVHADVVGHVEFCGPVSHEKLPEINVQASVLVYPSLMETQGIVVIEGMASGKPVIASQTGPGPELIENGQDGLLCDPHSPDSIAEKILMFLTDPTLRERLSSNARRKAQTFFSTDVLVQKNMAFYKACLAHL